MEDISHCINTASPISSENGMSPHLQFLHTNVLRARNWNERLAKNNLKPHRQKECKYFLKITLKNKYYFTYSITQ